MLGFGRGKEAARFFAMSSKGHLFATHYDLEVGFAVRSHKLATKVVGRIATSYDTPFPHFTNEPIQVKYRPPRKGNALIR